MAGNDSPNLASSFYEMTPLEKAWGWLPGKGQAEEPPDPRPLHPLEALEEILIPVLANPPCWLEFSGGRDSSALLAFSVHVAAREGLEPPVAYTRRYREDEDAEESVWQELVIRHIGLTQWECVIFDAEFDAIGPAAQAGLREYGVLWPLGIHTSKPTWDMVRNSTLITGDGGDEVFGSVRITPLRRFLAGPLTGGRTGLKRAIKAVLPPTLRRPLLHRALRARLDPQWLRPDAKSELIQEVLKDEISEPLRWDRGVVAAARTRALKLAQHNFHLMASLRAGVRYIHPLLDRRFVTAWNRFGGVLGFSGRGEAMRTLFGDYLPDAVLNRQSKGIYNRSVANTYSRAFAGNWTGSGVDPDLVDRDALRDEWMRPRPAGQSLFLLQAAWLADQEHESD